MKITALVTQWDYDKWKQEKTARPDSFCAGAMGANTVIVEESAYKPNEYENLVDAQVFVRCTFEVPDDQLSDKMKHRLGFYQGGPE